MNISHQLLSFPVDISPPPPSDRIHKNESRGGTIMKENIIIIDTDIFTDYPPSGQQEVTFSSLLSFPPEMNITVIYARDIPYEE